MSHHHKKNQWLTKISPQSKFFTYLYTTTKFFHSHAKRKNSYMTKIKIPTSTSTNKLLHSQNHNHMNFPIINITYPTKFFIIKISYPQNFAMSIKQSLHIPINCSHIHHEHIHISLTQNFHNANTPKVQTKIYPTTSQSTYVVKIPRATNIVQIAPLHKEKKKIHYKNATKPTFPNITNPTMPPKFQNNQMTNISPWNFQWNMQQYFSKQRNQRKTHLGVYMTIWSMGPRVLKKSIIIMPLKCWIIFLNMRC